jgi:hypothetical protein
MLSHAGQKMGMRWIFGLHEAIDQNGICWFLGSFLIGVIYDISIPAKAVE